MSKNDQFEKVSDFGDFVIYKTNCDCMDDNHQLTILIQYNQEQLEANLYFKTILHDPFVFNGKDSRFVLFFKNLFWRITNALKIFLLGEIILDEAFIFRGKEHLQEFGQALIDISEKVETEYKEKIILVEKLKYVTEQLSIAQSRLEKIGLDYKEKLN